MKVDVLKKILTDSRSVAMSKPCDVREYSFEDGANYILGGVRRCGKSSIMCDRSRILHDRGIAWEQIFYLDFSDECLKDFEAEEFDMLLLTTQTISPGKSYFFLDEINRVEGWEEYVLKFAHTGSLVYVSISDGLPTSPGIQSLLDAGFKFMPIYTYSIREYLLAAKIAFDSSSLANPKIARLVDDSFSEYQSTGGFPYSGSYLRKRDYIEGILQNDIMSGAISHNEIRNPMGFRLILKKMAENIGVEQSNQKLHSQVATAGVVLSRDDFMDYVDYAKSSFMVFSVDNHHAKITPDKSNVPKYFFTDVGLLNLISMQNDMAILKNIVAVQLKRKYGNDLEYYKSGQINVDVDFYVESEGLAIIVTDYFQGLERKKGMTSFEVIKSKHPEISKFIVLTKAQEETEETSKIKVQILPALKYLLS